jgi:ribosomal protein L24
MPTDTILALLVAERDKLNRAIEALGGSFAKRRGRPAKTSRAAVPIAASNLAPAKPAKKKRTFTAAQRKQQAERMRKFWEAKRKASK